MRRDDNDPVLELHPRHLVVDDVHERVDRKSFIVADEHYIFFVGRDTDVLDPYHVRNSYVFEVIVEIPEGKLHTERGEEPVPEVDKERFAPHSPVAVMDNIDVAHRGSV